MRLIDAIALRKNLSSCYMNELYPDWRTLPELTRMRIEILAKEFRFALDHSPTINAVPVVRCKDCKNRGTSYECPFRRLVFTEAEGYHYEDVTLDDSFCSFGKRKEDAPCRMT